jgi:electron transport complex protein RnfD
MWGGLPFGNGWFTGDPLYHILGGGLFLGAIFMATDYVTSPISFKGTIIYAFMLGLLTVIIRLWGGYPEGVSYSIVVMNLLVPILDRYLKPKIYGKSRKKAKEA